MQFNSFTFLSLFLPIIFLLIVCFRKFVRAQNYILLVASLIFYLWGELYLAPIFILFALINWAIPLQFGGHRKRLWMILLVTGDILFLGVFKYGDFIIQNVNTLFGMGLPFMHILLPLGISFYTFKGLSYAVDVYKGKQQAQKNFLQILLYLSFFPQVTAGPIMRYNDFERQLTYRTLNWEKTAQGLRRFVIGLSKKLILANTLGSFVDFAFGLEAVQLNVFISWTAAVCYMLQIYYDFSGYSDMAIGLGKLFGFETPENFRHPYLSGSIQEFWRRWHITLSSWFRDYVYIPLGGNRKGKWITYRNKILTFLLTGFWHGANWTFGIWGCIMGFFLVLEDKMKPANWKKGLNHFYVILIVILSFVVFRSESLAQAGIFFKAMVGHFSITSENLSLFLMHIKPSFLITALLGLVALYPWQNKLKSKHWDKISYILSFVLLFLCILQLSSATYQPFIYERF